MPDYGKVGGYAKLWHGGRISQITYGIVRVQAKPSSGRVCQKLAHWEGMPNYGMVGGVGYLDPPNIPSRSSA